MAVTPTSSNQAFIREVDEELRREQVADAARRWGLWVAGAIVAALAVFGGWAIWQHHRQSVRGEEGERIQAAFDAVAAGNTQAAAGPLAALSGSNSPGYRSLARFAQADLKLQAHDVKGAVALFASVANDSAAGEPLRGLALIRQTSAEFDTLPPATVAARLKPLAVRGNPYFGSAGELSALAYLKMNRPDVASALFSQLAGEETVPSTIRQRAVQMASVLAATSGVPGAAAQAPGLQALSVPASAAPAPSTPVQGSTK